MTASLHKLTAGSGYTYLTDQVARNDAAELQRDSLNDYYSSRGESPGQWRGKGLNGVDLATGSEVSEAQMKALFGEGLHPEADRIITEQVAQGASAKAAIRAAQLGSRFSAYENRKPHDFVVEVSRQYQEWNKANGAKSDAPVPPDVRSSIRTSTALRMFRGEFERDPIGQELSGWVARASRPPSQATAGFDVTFSPVKSVSTLWAIAPREVSEEVERAHDAAITAALEWIESDVSYTRRGHNGVRQVDIKGLMMAQFRHRDSRAGDPDLHTHVAISNKVQAVEDGKWLALDGAMLYKAMVAASERYNAHLEAEMEHRLGVSFAAKERADGKREVREIVGISPQLMEAWSSRRGAIEARQGELVAQFQAAHDRVPTPKELLAIAQQANLDTREAKHEPRSHAEQRQAWAQQAEKVLGGPDQAQQMVARALASTPVERRPLDLPALAESVVRRVEVGRASFGITHLLAEAQRQLRGRGLAPEELSRAAADVVTTALELDDTQVRKVSRTDPIHEPDALRRADGQSVYGRANSTLYTTSRIVAAEGLVLAWARRGGGRSIRPMQVSVAMLQSHANGRTLNAGQAQLVRAMATSGQRVQLALAPAGSGKTTAMGVLAAAWHTSGGNVVGLAPSAVAAAELGQSLDVAADTLHSLTTALADDRKIPRWAEKVDAGTLIVVDEAGMAATTDLALLTDWAMQRGASIRLIGDDRQLSAISAGGVLRDIAAEVGVNSLTELVRFKDPAEAAATLALREGLHEAIGFYLDRDRITVTDQRLAPDVVFDAWLADRDAGKESLMMAGSRAVVDELNRRARADRLDRLTPEERAATAMTVTLRGGVEVSVGDVIVTRQNDRRLRTTATDWVKNGDRWEITEVVESGAVQARHLHTDRTITLPPQYVAETVDLGYATTFHGAQGMTVMCAHSLFDGTETREQAYVAMSRGREENRAYFSPSGDGDPHRAIEEHQVIPQTAVDQFTQILDHDGAQVSARTAYREARDPHTLIGTDAGIYQDALAQAALAEVGADRAAEIHRAAEQLYPGLTDQLAWENTLLVNLLFRELEGEDSIAALAEAIESRPLDDVRDPAAVLDWRLDRSQQQGAGVGPLPWLRGIPDALARHEQWGPYLTARADQVRASAVRVAGRIEATPAAERPRWATPLTEPALLRDVAVWRAAMRVPDTDTTPTGPKAPRAHEQRYATTLDRRIREDDPAKRWAKRVAEIDRRIPDDPLWPVIARRLELADRSGADVAAAVDAAADRGPLPAEMPAAALWSRLSPDLTVADQPPQDAHRWQPDFTATLAARLPDGLGEQVIKSNQWPALVRAIKTAEAHGLPATDAITDAVALAGGSNIGRPGGVSADELATVLAARVDDLVTGAVPEPVEPAAETPAREVATPTAEPPAYTDADAPPEVEDLPPDPLDLDEAAPADHETVAPAEAPTADDGVRSRIVELHEQAAEFFAAQYAGSKAAEYITGRFGSDLTDDARVSIGYAPAEWSALTDHLVAAGATRDELVTAGLAKWSSRGTPIDVFRDRVVVGLRDSRGDLVGFSGRAAPGAGPDVPKYLNSPTTAAFQKGETLYGLAENADRLAAGATPVRAEGVFDAIAITTATEGRAVGLAPMGTALTEVQAEWIAAAAQGGPVLVATDQDTAGRAAAGRDYEQLTAQGVDARRLVLIDPANPAAPIKDPAEAVQRDGGEAIRRSLDGIDVAPRMAGEVAVDRINQVNPDHLNRADVRVFVAREVAQVIAASPAEHWGSEIERAGAAMASRGSADQDWCTDLIRTEVTAAGVEWAPPAEPARAGELQQLAGRVEARVRAERMSAMNARLDALATSTISRTAAPEQDRGSMLDRLDELTNRRSIDRADERGHDESNRYLEDPNRGRDVDGPGLSR